MRKITLEHVREFAFPRYIHIRYGNTLVTICGKSMVACKPEEPSKTLPLYPNCDRKYKRLLEDPNNLIKWT